MERCIGITKKGTQCTHNGFYHRCCGVHRVQGLVARPDITQAPQPPLQKGRQIKLDPYYISNCCIYDCQANTVFGEFVCQNHYSIRYRVEEGMKSERERFTAYFQQLYVQQRDDPRKNEADFQQRIEADKQRRNEIQRIYQNPEERKIDPFYLTQCQFGPCRTENRFGRFTCTVHKPQEAGVKTRLMNEENAFSLHYQDLLYKQANDPRRNDEDFNLRVRAQKALMEQRRQQRLAEQNRHNELVELARQAINQPPILQQAHQALQEAHQALQEVHDMRPQIHQALQAQAMRPELHQALQGLNNVVQVLLNPNPNPRPQREDEQGRWIFERDPEGGVNLRALANDRQSIHRSSVQEDTIKNIEIIKKVELVEPMLPDLWDGYYIEYLMEIDNAKIFTLEQYNKIREVLATEGLPNVVSFNISFVDLFGHIWSFIKPHKDKLEMIKRLGEELIDCRGMCSNGKIARLVNALQGFMDGLSMPVDKMELFQGKFSKLMEMPKMKRVAAALDLFKEYEIPEDKQEEWFMPLVE